MVQIGFDTAFGLIKSLSTGDFMKTAVIETLWTAGTGGWGQVTDTTMGIAAGTLFAGEYFGEFFYDYNNYANG